MNEEQFIYENHLGGFYTSSTEYDYDMLYCDSCGDSDTFLGVARNRAEAWKIMNQFKGKYYTIEFLREFVKENFKRERK